MNMASMIAMWFSRRREFRADSGGAALAGRGKMIAALERLPPRQPDPQVLQAVQPLTEGVGNTELRLALAALAANVLSKSRP